jgi:hypothetical protein
VEVVPELVVVVADVVVVDVGVVVVVDVLDDVVVEVVVALVELLVVVDDVVVLDVVWQSCAASCATVLIPCKRLRLRVGLSVACRFATSLPKPETPFAAAPH